MLIDANKQSIELTGVGNARELGGYPAADGRNVRRGILLRTAKLSTASDEDIRRLKEDYKLAKIIDMRSVEEIEGSPEIAVFTGSPKPEHDPSVEGAEYIHLPVIDMQKQMSDTVEWAKAKGLYPITDMLKMLTVTIESGYVGAKLYVGFLEDECGKRGYSRFFRKLLSLDEGRALLFHCTQGKDRTGVAAMLILSALGVSEEIIVEDYMLTNIFNSERIAKERKMLEMSGKLPPDKIDDFLMVMDKVKESTMTGVISHLKEKYDSVKNYIVSELGVSEDEIGQLKDKFLI